MPRYDYPGGVLEHERQIVDKFENECLSYTMKHGARIGEAAMNGDLDAEEIIRRQRLFVEGIPELRPMNLQCLYMALQRWVRKQ